MAEKLVRTSFKEPSGAERQGSTALKESRVDVERYVQPLLRVHGSGLHDGGVAAGLAVSGTQGGAEVRVAAGVAVDASGRHISLAVGGFAKLDDLTLVKVKESGAVIPTGAGGGTFVVTIGWAETFDKAAFQANGVFQLLETPVIRLRPAPFVDDGAEVVLAQAQLDGTGAVTALSAGGRRAAGITVENLTFSGPQITTTGQTSTVHHIPYTGLRTHPDGGLRLSDLDAGADRVVLDAAGNIGIGLGATKPERTLHVEGREIHSGGPAGGFSFADRDVEEFVEEPDEGQRWRWYAKDGTARLWSDGDFLSVAPNGNVGIGIDAKRAWRQLHVEGSEIHSGGGGGGFSFADRSIRSFVDRPTAGQRWVWYSANGTARLWSGVDRLAVSATDGLDVAGRMRLRCSRFGPWPGIWFFREGGGLDDGDLGFVGMMNTTQIGFRGRTQADWGLLMDTAGGTVWVQGAILVGGTFDSRFAKDVRVAGTLYKANLQFEIDHPLDPANKFLHHSGVESDEMKNIYDGVADLDSQGRAEVVLPDWFESLNENYRYQLTPIGASAPELHIADELRDGRFTIAGGRPGAKVCWLVSGVRHDAYAKAHPLQVETPKSAQEAGLFMHPEEHNEPAERSLIKLLTPPANDSKTKAADARRRGTPPETPAARS